MNGFAPHLFALVLLCAAFAAALAALTARSLFAMCMHLAGFGALAAATLLSLGSGDAALSVALSVGAWAPLLLLAGMLLSARAAKAMNKNAPWPSLLAAAFAGGAMLMAAPDIGPLLPVEAAPATIGAGFWLAPLMLATAAACVGLLGYGERGALRTPADDPR
ncbi:MAG: hypothetical protein H7124_04980 [Phycisphaerales bacterium]|nr:hypothetical protein [Hyphomonadaceae bacterium]